MQPTPEEARAVLDLCGTTGNADKGVLFLQMMYDCSEDEAGQAVATIRESVHTLPTVEGK